MCARRTRRRSAMPRSRAKADPQWEDAIPRPPPNNCRRNLLSSHRFLFLFFIISHPAAFCTCSRRPCHECPLSAGVTHKRKMKPASTQRFDPAEFAPPGDHEKKLGRFRFPDRSAPWMGSQAHARAPVLWHHTVTSIELRSITITPQTPFLHLRPCLIVRRRSNFIRISGAAITRFPVPLVPVSVIFTARVIGACSSSACVSSAPSLLRSVVDLSNRRCPAMRCPAVSLFVLAGVNVLHCLSLLCPGYPTIVDAVRS